MSGVAGVKCDAARIHIVAIFAMSPYILILPDALILKYLKIKIIRTEIWAEIVCKHKCVDVRVLHGCGGLCA